MSDNKLPDDIAACFTDFAKYWSHLPGFGDPVSMRLKKWVESGMTFDDVRTLFAIVNYPARAKTITTVGELVAVIDEAAMSWIHNRSRQDKPIPAIPGAPRPQYPPPKKPSTMPSPQRPDVLPDSTPPRRKWFW